MKYNPDEFSAYEYDPRYPDRITLKSSGANSAAGSESSNVNAAAGGSKRCMPDNRGSHARVTSSMRRY